MSPEERLQQIVSASFGPDPLRASDEDVTWLVDQVRRLNAENARQTDKIAAIRAEVTAIEDGEFPTIVRRLREIVGPR
jgi:hypothetical protein